MSVLHPILSAHRTIVEPQGRKGGGGQRPESISGYQRVIPPPLHYDPPEGAVLRVIVQSGWWTSSRTEGRKERGIVQVLFIIPRDPVAPAPPPPTPQQHRLSPPSPPPSLHPPTHPHSQRVQVQRLAWDTVVHTGGETLALLCSLSTQMKSETGGRCW